MPETNYKKNSVKHDPKLDQAPEHIIQQRQRFEELSFLQIELLNTTRECTHLRSQVHKLKKSLSEQTRFSSSHAEDIGHIDTPSERPHIIIARLRRALLQKERQRYEVESKLMLLLKSGTYRIEQNKHGLEKKKTSEEHQNNFANENEALRVKLKEAKKEIHNLNDEILAIHESRKIRIKHQRRMVQDILKHKNNRIDSPLKRIRGGLIFMITYPQAGEGNLKKFFRQHEDVHVVERRAYKLLRSIIRFHQVAKNSSFRSFESDRNFSIGLLEVFLKSIGLPNNFDYNKKIAINLTSIEFNSDDLEDLVEFITTRLPSSKIVFNIRNPETAAVRGLWKELPEKESLEKIRYLNKIIEHRVKSESPSRVILFRYEDHFESPETLNVLSAFLKLTHRKNNLD